jgi:putative ABC transport system substrate-binding protein
VRRRDFIAGFSAIGASPRAVIAQLKLSRIGVLVPANPEPFWSQFRAGLREHGYVEGQNVVLELRSADGHPDRLSELAAELVRLNVDIIVAQFTPAIFAARHATSDIPIIMAWAGDPIGTGLISSLARPGGNITGLAGPGGAPKMLELARDVLPSMQRVAALANAPDPFSRVFVKEIEEASRASSITAQIIQVQGEGELETAFAAMVKERADAVIMQTSLSRKPAIELALKYHLPLLSGTPLLPREGGLMSFSIQQDEMYRRAAAFVGRILQGARPADLPVEQATRYEIVINLKTAQALGITVPPTVLARADEVIE